MPFPVYIAALGLLFLVLFSAEYLLSLAGIIRFDPYYLMWPLLAVACFVTALLWFGLASLMRYVSCEAGMVTATAATIPTGSDVSKLKSADSSASRWRRACISASNHSGAPVGGICKNEQKN